MWNLNVMAFYYADQLKCQIMLMRLRVINVRDPLNIWSMSDDSCERPARFCY